MIYIAADHGGFELKNEIVKYLKEKSIDLVDLGTTTGDAVDYPPVAQALCKKVIENNSNKGILVCGTGIGMSIAANKVNGIRAAHCTDYYSAKYTRLHNNSNVLCLGGRITGSGLALELVQVFLDTEFLGGRHQRRVDEIIDIENSQKQQA